MKYLSIEVNGVSWIYSRPHVDSPGCLSSSAGFFSICPEGTAIEDDSALRDYVDANYGQ